MLPALLAGGVTAVPLETSRGNTGLAPLGNPGGASCWVPVGVQLGLRKPGGWLCFRGRVFHSWWHQENNVNTSWQETDSFLPWEGWLPSSACWGHCWVKRAGLLSQHPSNRVKPHTSALAPPGNCGDGKWVTQQALEADSGVLHSRLSPNTSLQAAKVYPAVLGLGRWGRWPSASIQGVLGQNCLGGGLGVLGEEGPGPCKGCHGDRVVLPGREQHACPLSLSLSPGVGGVREGGVRHMAKGGASVGQGNSIFRLHWDGNA